MVLNHYSLKKLMLVNLLFFLVGVGLDILFGLLFIAKLKAGFPRGRLFTIIDSALTVYAMPLAIIWVIFGQLAIYLVAYGIMFGVVLLGSLFALSLYDEPKE